MKNKLPRKEKKKLIKEGGKRHYWVMASKSNGSVSTEHIPVEYNNFNNFSFDWTMPTSLYLKKFREDKKSRKIQ